MARRRAPLLRRLHDSLLRQFIFSACVLLIGFYVSHVLHSWLRSIEAEELRAVLQLGLLSAVILPLLPDEGFGPFGALNPYQMWLAVVLTFKLGDSLGSPIQCSAR